MEIILFVGCLLIALYLLSMKPAKHRADRFKSFQSYYYAHRGLFNNKKGIPENSMAAFKRAVEGGYGIEMDIRLTKDLVPVVFHDRSLHRMCNSKNRIEDLTCQELQNYTLLDTDYKIEKFADVLHMIDGRVPLIVELKAEKNYLNVAKYTNQVLENYKGLYCIESFNPLIVRWFRINRPEILRGQLSDSFFLGRKTINPFSFFLEGLNLNFYVKPDFVAYNAQYYKKWQRRFCRKFYNNTAVAWTIKSKNQLEKMKKEYDLFIFEDFQP